MHSTFRSLFDLGCHVTWPGERGKVTALPSPVSPTQSRSQPDREFRIMPRLRGRNGHRWG